MATTSKEGSRRAKTVIYAQEDSSKSFFVLVTH
jgi:hypothetical protein